MINTRGFWFSLLKDNVTIFKSDPPILDSATAKNQKDFHKPVGSVLAEPNIEDDPYYSSSSDSDEASPKRRYDLQLIMLQRVVLIIFSPPFF